GIDERKAAALLLGPTAWCGARSRSGTGGARTARRARAFIIFGFEREPGSRPGARSSLVRAEALLGDLAGLAFGLLVVLAAIFFLALAGIGRFALGAVDILAAGAPASLFFCDLAFFSLANARIGKGVGAGSAFLVGKRAQDDAGRLRLVRLRQ